MWKGARLVLSGMEYEFDMGQSVKSNYANMKDAPNRLSKEACAGSTVVKTIKNADMINVIKQPRNMDFVSSMEQRRRRKRQERNVKEHWMNWNCYQSLGRIRIGDMNWLLE